MEEILHRLIDSSSHYLHRFIHPRWLFGISEPSTELHFFRPGDPELNLHLPVLLVSYTCDPVLAVTGLKKTLVI